MNRNTSLALIIFMFSSINVKNARGDAGPEDVFPSPVVVDFDDIGMGEPGTGALATTTVTIHDVKFTIPALEKIFVIPPFNGPFTSRAINFWTYGEALTVELPEPAYRVSFDASQTGALAFPAIELVYATGLTPFTFPLSLSSLTTVTFDLPTPQTTFHVVYQGGSSSLMGMDDLKYYTSPVPEPALAGLLSLGCAAALMRRRIER